MITPIPISQLDPDPQNPNVCPEEMLTKLKANISHVGQYQPLIVRPHPTESGRFMIIDGHHRKIVLEQLGHDSVNCLVWDLPEDQVALVMATLNRLRGTDVPQKRAKLLATLTQSIIPEDLASLIPETAAQIRDLLKLNDMKINQMRETIKAEIAKEKASLPIPIHFLIPAEDKPIWDEAYETFSAGLSDRGKVLIRICTKALEGETHGEPE